MKKTELRYVMFYLITIFLVIGMFLLASMVVRTDKKADLETQSILFTEWEKVNPNPPKHLSSIEYKDKKYFFVIEKDTSYWAYNAGFEYKKAFTDASFWIIFLASFACALTIAFTNYNTGKDKQKEKESFINVLLDYQEKKKLVLPYIQFIGEFCLFKNKETLRLKREDIIHEAGFENEKTFLETPKEKLEKWQKKKIKQLERIKIRQLTSRDLVQENNGKENNKIVFLPISERENDKRFMIKVTIKKLVNFFLSGLTISLTLIFSNWATGIIVATGLVATAFTAYMAGNNYVANDLRQRFIGKTNLLIEFDNIKDFIIENSVLKNTKEKEEVKAQMFLPNVVIPVEVEPNEETNIKRENDEAI